MRGYQKLKYEDQYEFNNAWVQAYSYAKWLFIPKGQKTEFKYIPRQTGLTLVMKECNTFEKLAKRVEPLLVNESRKDFNVIQLIISKK